MPLNSDFQESIRRSLGSACVLVLALPLTGSVTLYDDLTSLSLSFFSVKWKQQRLSHRVVMKVNCVKMFNVPDATPAVVSTQVTMITGSMIAQYSYEPR